MREELPVSYEQLRSELLDQLPANCKGCLKGREVAVTAAKETFERCLKPEKVKIALSRLVVNCAGIEVTGEGFCSTKKTICRNKDFSAVPVAVSVENILERTGPEEPLTTGITDA